MEKTDNSRFIALVLRWQVMQVLLDARPSITLGRQKRTRECYYLELFRGLLLKQREIGHAKYVFFFFCFLFARDAHDNDIVAEYAGGHSIGIH